MRIGWLLLLLGSFAAAQVPTPIRSFSSLPGCNGGNAQTSTDAGVLISGGVGTLNICTATNTWATVGWPFNVTSVASTIGGSASLVPLNTGQNTSNTNWFSPGGAGLFAPTPVQGVGTLTGGSFTSGGGLFVVITVNQGATHSFASLEREFALTTPFGCSGGGSCTALVVAPTLIGTQTYSVYSSSTSGTEQLNAACTNITSNCVLTAFGAGGAFPATNTAAGVLPSPLGHLSDCYTGLNASVYVLDSAGNWQTAACIDPDVNFNQFTTKNFLSFSRPVMFNDSGINPKGSTSFTYNAALNVYVRASQNANGLGQQILLDDAPGDVTAYGTSWRGIYSECDIQGNPTWTGPDGGCHALRGTTAVLTPSGTCCSGGLANSWGLIGVSGFFQRTSGSAVQVLGNAVGVSGKGQDNGSGNGFFYVEGVRGEADFGGPATGTFGLAVHAAAPANGYFPQGHAAFYVDVNWAAGANRWGYLDDSNGLQNVTAGPWAMPALATTAGAFPFTASVTGLTSLSTLQISPSGAFTVAQGGTAGATSYTYGLVAKDANGGTVQASGTQATVTGNATLNGTNFNAIQWTCIPGVASYDIYRTASAGTPASVGKIGNVVTTLQRGASRQCTLSDTGLTGDTTTMPAGNTTGTIQAQKLLTLTKCAAVGTAANPSVASCASASAGLFSCATNASTGTCQVNTTAVTATSVITITQNAADGTPLGVTCNTTADVPTGPRLLSKSAGVSFTINLGTVAVNPACYEYTITN